MRVMILDNDPWNAEVLEKIILSISPKLKVDIFSRVHQAIAAHREGDYQLVMSELSLPDAPGSDLLKQIRRTDSTTPLVIITGQADRSSIMAVRPLGISAFITKPFQVRHVLDCLSKLLPADTATDNSPAHSISFKEHLATLPAQALDLPVIAAVRSQLLSYLDGQPFDLRKLAESMKHDPALCAKLVAVANSTAYNTDGRACLSHLEALRKLGVQTSLNIALGMALRQFTQQAEGPVKEMIERQLLATDQLAEKAVALAVKGNKEPALLHTAALLHRMGELCVLYHAQVWVNSGSSLDEDELLQAINLFSENFANSLKVNWQLPMPLRELIGAVYALPKTQIRRKQVIMRLAAAEQLGEDAASVERLKRMAGLT